jgi:hypothetical protein
MKCKLIFYLSGLFPLFLKAQENEAVNNFFKVQGTVMMAVKGNDGIILVADSRMIYRSDSTNEILAFQDGMPKIFPLRKFALAIAGDFSDGETRIKKMIAEFINSNPAYNTPEECLYTFGVFIKGKYPDYFKKLVNNTILAVGYSPEAKIAIWINNKTYIISPGNWTSNVYPEMDSLHLFNGSGPGSCKHLADLAETAMKSYIKAFHKEREMGGYFSVLKINPNNSFSWLKNDFSANDFNTECEANKAWYFKNTKFEYPDSEKKKIINGFNKLIRARCH